MQRKARMRQMAPFDIPESLYYVRIWFTNLLRTFTWDSYAGDLIDSLEMEGPRTVLISMPDGDELVDEIILVGFRTPEQPGWPDQQPRAGARQAQAARESLGPMIAFRFYPIKDGHTTRVWASYSEEAMVVPLLFEEIVAELIEKKYPSVGPLWQQHAAKRARQRLEIVDKWIQTQPHPSGETGTELAAPALAAGVTPQKRRRGRLPTPAKEKNRICAGWLKVQYDVTQEDFCNGKGISASLLRSWLKHYPYPES